MSDQIVNRIFHLIQKNSLKCRAANTKENACTRVPYFFLDSPGFREERRAAPVPGLGLWLLLFSLYSSSDHITTSSNSHENLLFSETMTKTLNRTTDRNEDERAADVHETHSSSVCLWHYPSGQAPCLGVYRCSPLSSVDPRSVYRELGFEPHRSSGQRWSSDDSNGSLIPQPMDWEEVIYYVKKNSSLSSGKIDLSWVSHKRR